MDKFIKKFDIETRTKYFIRVLAYFLLVSIIIFSLLVIGEKSLNKKEKKIQNEAPSAFQKVNLEAKGAVVWDVINHRELFSKNPDEPLPLASITKVMTAVTMSGKLEGDKIIIITEEDLSPEGDSQLVVGDTWKVSDLRDFTLLTSSNDGAFALATLFESKTKNNLAAVSVASAETNVVDNRAKFIKEMNETASRIGLSNSKFFNEHGLDEAAGKGGAYGSARDMASLFEYTIKNYPEILEITRYKNAEFESVNKKYSVENTNVFIDKIPNIIASKTGFTDLAGGNLVVAYDAGLNRPIIISVLGSSETGRFDDVMQLVQASLKYIHDN